MSDHKANISVSNPYAAPEIEPISDRSMLPPGTDYRVVDGKLYCKNNVNLSAICWLTGAQSAPHQCRRIRSRVHSGKSPVTTILMLAFAALTLFFWISGVHTWFSRSIHAIGMVLLAIQGFGGFRPAIFSLKLGRSTTAIAAEKSATRFLLGQIPIHVGFIIWVKDVPTRWPIAIIAAAWTAGWLIVAYLWLPKRFRATARKADGEYFVVTNLEPEFLAAVQRRLETQKGETSFISSDSDAQSTHS